MAEEFHTPEEYHVPEEFHKVKEVYVSAPEFLDHQEGYGTTGEKASSDSGKSRAKQLRKIMMYLAATVTTMGTLMSFSSEAKTESFDKRDYLASHRDWYNAQDDEYIYFGDNGIGWIALGSEDGKTYDDFYHYKTWNYMAKDIDDYTCSAYGYEIDWSQSKIDSKKSYAEWKLVQTEDGYVIDAYEPGHPEIAKRLVPLSPSQDNYPGKDYMKDYYNLSMQELLDIFDTFKHREDGPEYGNVTKIKFNKDGTGSFTIDGKNKSFTYTADDDRVSNFITIKYKGKSARACFYFFSEKPTMMFFGGLLDMPEDGFSWFDATNEPAKKPAGKQSVPTPVSTEKAPSESEPSASETKAEYIDAEPYLNSHRDWYSKDLRIYVFFGENGEGHLYSKDFSGDNYYRRLKYKTSGSRCEIVAEKFNSSSLSYDTETMTCYTVNTGNEVQLWFKQSASDDRPIVFTEYPRYLKNYLEDFNGMDTGDVLLKCKSFSIIDNGPIKEGFNKLEFTSKNSGVIYWEDRSESFTYSTSSDSINPTFNLYFKGERYLGWLTYKKDKPGIILFNPQMDGTHGRFQAD